MLVLQMQVVKVHLIVVCEIIYFPCGIQNGADWAFEIATISLLQFQIPFKTK